MATNNAINTENPIQVARGGTGAATLTGVLTGNGASAVTANAITQYGTVIAGASNAVSSVAPSATSGVPYISQGAASNPAFGTAVVAGGGTGATTLTDRGVLVGRGTAAVEATAGGATGETLMGSTGANPSFTNSPSFGGSVTAATTITATAGDLTLTNGDALIGNTDAGVTAPFVYFKKSRSGGVITSGDDLGEVAFQGHDGASYFTSARIRADSSGTIGAGRIASTMQFYTAPDSVTASTLRMSIAPTGEVTIAAPDSGTGLTVTAGGITATAGAITATSGNIVATSGDVSIVSGNVLLPTTTSAVGQVKINASAFMHAFGTDNAFVGFNCGNFTLSGANQNTGMGSNALNALTSGDFNSGFGRYALNAVTTGSLNTACGDEALAALTTGNRNTAIGYNAGGSLTTTDSSNICIGSETTGTAGNSNTLIIGAGAGTGNGQLNRAFIHGIRGITTGQADAVAVLVDSVGQLGTVSSSIRYKENVEDMSDSSSALMDLRPVTFNYKSHPGHKQFGLIAEEVYEIMPQLTVRNADGDIESVKYHDLPVMLLNEMQKLMKRIEVLEGK